MDKIDEIKKEIEIIDTVDDSNISDLDALCEDIIELNNEGWDTAILMDPLFRILFPSLCPYVLIVRFPPMRYFCTKINIYFL